MIKTKVKSEKGITLVALVVTIIVLMILAGITLSLVLGQNGIIAKAQYAKMQSEISGEKEQLSMASAEATLDNTGIQATLDQMKDKIVEKELATTDNIKVGDDRLQVTTPKNHTYTIDQNGNVVYIGEGTVTVPDLTQASVTFLYTPSTWTNGGVQVGITTTVNGYGLQYSTDGSTWNKYTSPITITSNGTIYARLWDGINYGGVATGNVSNIDTNSPVLVLSQNAETATITINATDMESGINNIQYNNSGTWQDIPTNNITNGKSATKIAPTNGIYTFRTIDNAGNVTTHEITVTGIVSLSSIKGGAIISTTSNTPVADDNSNILTLPCGFKIANDSATKRENGIVIEDKYGNQFVWIPVVNISNYERTDFGASYDNSGYNSYSETMPSDEQTSVRTYHGYYIGRYEAGDSVSTASKALRAGGSSVTNSVAVKKVQVPYNYVTRDQANTLSIGMKTTNGYIAMTRLCSSYAWDTAVNFIQSTVSNYGISSNQGNYQDTTFSYMDIGGTMQMKAAGSDVLIPTGETTPVCNIYDMGGNEWEWTTETDSVTNNNVVCRGGDLYHNYASTPAGFRYNYSNDGSNASVAFRITLFM